MKNKYSSSSTVIPPTPELLYRYRHFQGEHREWTANILRRSVLFFSSPASFDDPLDCKVHFQLSASEAQLKRNQQKLYKKFTPQLNRAQRRVQSAKDIQELDRENFLTSLTTGLQKKVDKTGILCLSKAPDNVVLWSQYAAEHTGLCLIFSVAADIAFFARAQPVTYSKEWPMIDALSDSDERMVDVFFLTKALEWAYQEEWRIIDHNTGAGEKAFAPKSLVGVILGAKISTPDRTFTVNCLRERSTPVALYEAQIQPGRYGVSIHKVEF